MKIAVTATGPTLDEDLDPRFGRCAYFLIVETESTAFEAVENANAALGQGAGIQSAQLVAARGVKCVITGSCGPKAYDALAAANIGVILGCSGSIRSIIEQYKAGQLDPAASANVASHAGATGGPSQSSNVGAPTPQQSTPAGGRGRGPCGNGMGRGRGRGMERGGGGGMGRGRGRGCTPQSG